MRSTAAWRRLLKRLRLYETDGGADWVQFEAPHSVAEIKRARKVVKGPFSAMKGQLPRALTLAEHKALGLNAAWYTFLPDQVLKDVLLVIFSEFKKKDMRAWDEFVSTHPDTPFTGGAKLPWDATGMTELSQVGSEVRAQAQAEIAKMRHLSGCFFCSCHFASIRGSRRRATSIKGKQMKIVVGASAGAASDLYARVVAQLFAETNSWKARDHRAKHAGRRLDDRGELCLQRCQTGRADAWRGDGADLFRPAASDVKKFSSTGRSSPGSARRRKTTSCFSSLGSAVQNAARFTQGDRCAALRRLGSRQHGILHPEIVGRSFRREAQHGYGLSRRCGCRPGGRKK